MSAIYEALRRLCEVEEAISAGGLRIHKGWAFPPPGRQAIETPCVLHEWSFSNESRFPNEFRQRDYTIRIHVLVAKAGGDSDVTSEQAAVLDEAFFDAFDRDVQLGDGGKAQNIRGEPETWHPATLLWNEIPYVTLTYLMDLHVYDVATRGP